MPHPRAHPGPGGPLLVLALLVALLPSLLPLPGAALTLMSSDDATAGRATTPPPAAGVDLDELLALERSVASPTSWRGSSGGGALAASELGVTLCTLPVGRRTVEATTLRMTTCRLLRDQAVCPFTKGGASKRGPPIVCRVVQ